MEHLTQIYGMTPALKEELEREVSEYRREATRRIQSLMPTKPWLQPSAIEKARMNLLALQYILKEERLNAFIEKPQSIHPYFEENYLNKLQYYAEDILDAYWALGIYHYDDILYDAYMRLGEELLRDFSPFLTEAYLKYRTVDDDKTLTEDLRYCRDDFNIAKLNEYIEGE